MTTIVVEGDEPNNGDGLVAPGSPPAEVTTPEAAVLIAAIEGETQVELARLDLERTELHIEADAAAQAAFAETFNSDQARELEEWRARALAAETELEGLKTPALVVVTEPSILEPSSEPPPSLPPSGEGEGPEAPESALEAAADPLAEAPPSPPPEPPKRHKRARWI